MKIEEMSLLLQGNVLHSDPIKSSCLFWSEHTVNGSENEGSDSCHE